MDPALVVVTTAAADERAGCLVGFHCQCSIEPEQYATWISKANRTCQVAVQAEWLAVHYLDHTQQALAAHFGELTGDSVDKFASVPWTPGPDGVPLLDECPDRLLLRRLVLIDPPGADHLCIVSSVVEASFGERVGPYRLTDAEGMTPGHEAEEA